MSFILDSLLNKYRVLYLTLYSIYKGFAIFRHGFNSFLSLHRGGGLSKQAYPHLIDLIWLCLGGILIDLIWLFLRKSRNMLIYGRISDLL